MQSNRNKDENLKQMKNLVYQAAKQGASLVALPEYWNYLDLGVDSKVLNYAEPIPGPTIECLQNLAHELGIFIHGGSILEKSEDNKIYNTSVIIGPEGITLNKYRKLHLSEIHLPDNSTVVLESNNVKSGNSVEIVKTKLGTFGFSICFDMRFPELYRILVLKGAEIIFVPSAFPIFTGKDHWCTLLQARAIENQVYIIAANQFGTHSVNEVYYGRSLIINPWGIILSKAPDEPGVIIAEINLDYLRKVRQSIPCIKCRRADIYSQYM